ncbi:hypothetical protein P8452_73394 [Trifolium repens]|nr:hypothetical protein P8452_73394 [Trifolium repens]
MTVTQIPSVGGSGKSLSKESSNRPRHLIPLPLLHPSSHYSEYPPKRKKMCLSGSVRLSWVGRVRPEMLCLLARCEILTFSRTERQALVSCFVSFRPSLHSFQCMISPRAESIAPETQRVCP